MYLKKELYELIQSDESIFDFIQESALDGFWYWDLEKPENEWMNAKFWTVLGYDPDEMPHKSVAWQSIINQDDLKVANENFTKHLENPNHPYDQVVRYAHKDGSTVWIRCRGLAVRDTYGKPIRMLGAHQDISDIKRSEQELIEAKEKAEDNETQTKSMLQTAMDGFWIVDMETRLIEANEMACKMLGYSYEEMLELRISDIDSVETEEQTQKRKLEIIEKGEARFESKHRHKNGETIDVELSVKKHPAKNLMFVFIHDITERKQAEEKLRENEEKYRALSEATFEAIFFSEKGICLGQNKNAEKLFGYTLLEAVGKSATDWIAPEDRQTVLDNILSGYEEPYEIRALRKDGSTFYAEIQGKMMHYQQRLVRVTALRDITERKQAEEKLKLLEQQSHAWLENSPTCTKIVDLDFNLQYMSSAGLKELKIDDIKPYYGKPYPFNFYPESFKVKMTGNMKRAKETGEIITQEAPVVDINGNEVWYHSIIVPAKDENGQIEYLIIVSMDITERKQAEKALLAKIDELERFHKLTVGREITMIELKKEVNNLLNKLGQDNKYKIV